MSSAELMEQSEYSRVWTWKSYNIVQVQSREESTERHLQTDFRLVGALFLQMQKNFQAKLLGSLTAGSRNG
jgi:hypothetical protein